MTTKPFYDHLDVCKRCRENPRAMCAVGARLLDEATQALAIFVAPEPKPPGQA